MEYRTIAQSQDTFLAYMRYDIRKKLREVVSETERRGFHSSNTETVKVTLNWLKYCSIVSSKERPRPSYMTLNQDTQRVGNLHYHIDFEEEG